MTSTTPNGHAPAKKPYTLDSKQANAKTKVNARCRRSSAYVTIMRVTATTPNAVIAFINPSIPRSPSPWSSPRPARHSPYCRSARFDCYPPVEDRSSISTIRRTTSRRLRFMSLFVPGAYPWAPSCLRSTFSVPQSPRLPSLSASASTHWPDGGIVLDRCLGPRQGPGQKDHGPSDGCRSHSAAG